jgi:hypothetical protein
MSGRLVLASGQAGNPVEKVEALEDVHLSLSNSTRTPAGLSDALLPVTAASD